MPALDLHHTSATVTGANRADNEDTLAFREPETSLERVSHGTIWVIADGIGSGGRGVEAGRRAASEIIERYWSSIAPSPSDRLREALEQTNALLFAANDPAASSAERAGATCVAGAIVGERLVLAHVGRARAYVLRDAVLRQLTDDHTWAAEQLRAGALEPAEAVSHPRRSLITRALGIRPSVRIDQFEERLRVGDVVLLCSDGLHRFVDDLRIAALLGPGRGSGDPATALIEEARVRTAQDDASAIVVRVCPAAVAREPALDRISLLLRVGPELSGSLDLDDTLSAVLRRLLELTGGDRAAILLRQTDGQRDEFVLRAGHNVSTNDPVVGFSRAIAQRAVTQRAAQLIDDALADALADPLAGSGSIVTQGIRAAACVPLLRGEDAIGALYVDSPTRSGIFDGASLDLLILFASLAAPAIENARLHATLVERTQELERARRRQESLVRSLSSALVAVDGHGYITQWNPAAAEIFGTEASKAIGRTPDGILPRALANWFSGMMVQAEAADRSLIFGQGWEGPLGVRARVVLAGRVARIRDDNGAGGYVFIINDRTDITLVEEARRREQEAQERQRALFSRYLAPSVVERAIRSPDSVRLGGARQQVSVLFADVRGFTGYTEARPPEEVVDVLNAYLDLATREIFDQFGTLDKFIGDGVMAIFGAPMPNDEHALAAVRAALAMRDRALELRRATGTTFSFGIGINTGETVVGNIGTTQLMNYTAIGDVVNVANRLEGEARAGEILISQATLDAAGGALVVEELGPIYVKGRALPVVTHKLLRER